MYTQPPPQRRDQNLARLSDSSRIITWPAARCHSSTGFAAGEGRLAAVGPGFGAAVGREHDDATRRRLPCGLLRYVPTMSPSCSLLLPYFRAGASPRACASGSTSDEERLALIPTDERAAWSRISSTVCMRSRRRFRVPDAVLPQRDRSGRRCRWPCFHAVLQVGVSCVAGVRDAPGPPSRLEPRIRRIRESWARTVAVVCDSASTRWQSNT